MLVSGEAGGDDLQLAARLAARFSQGRDSEEVTVAVNDGQGNGQMLTVRPLTADEIPANWYL